MSSTIIPKGSLIGKWLWITNVSSEYSHSFIVNITRHSFHGKIKGEMEYMIESDGVYVDINDAISGKITGNTLELARKDQDEYSCKIKGEIYSSSDIIQCIWSDSDNNSGSVLMHPLKTQYHHERKNNVLLCENKKKMNEMIQNLQKKTKEIENNKNKMKELKLMHEKQQNKMNEIMEENERYKSVINSLKNVNVKYQELNNFLTSKEENNLLLVKNIKNGLKDLEKGLIRFTANYDENTNYNLFEQSSQSINYDDDDDKFDDDVLIKNKVREQFAYWIDSDSDNNE